MITPSLPGLEVVRTGPAPRERRVYGVTLGVVGRDWFIHNNSVNNLMRGVAERVLYRVRDGVYVRPPVPAAGVFHGRMAAFAARLAPHLPSTTPLTPDEFVAMYRGRRRGVYARAVESLRTRPVEPRDSNMAYFVKAEKLDGTSKPDPAPRVIQPRSPRYNVCVGQYLKPLECLIYRALAVVCGGRVVAKGLNAEGTASLLRSKWERFARPVAVGLDAERFDQHVHVDALRWEHATYVKCFRGADRAELARLLGWQGTVRPNTGRGRATDGRVKSAVFGGRASGDMNTSLGNCLLMCSMLSVYLAAKQIKFDFVNNGDDCVVFIEERDLRRLADLPDWFLEMGFSMKVEAPVDVFEQIEFCKAQPVWAGGRWVMVRRPADSMGKDLVTTIPLTRASTYQKYLDAIGVAGLALTSGVPVLQEFYDCMGRSGLPSRMSSHPTFETGMMALARGMESKRCDVSDAARVSFWLAFGIKPDTQIELEEYYRSSHLTWAPPTKGIELNNSTKSIAIHFA